MTRRVTDVEANMPDVELITVREQSRACVASKCVLPIGATLGRQKQLCTRCPRQLARPRYEIGVDVCFSDVLDAKRVAFGGIDVLRDITIRVHDNRGPGRLTSDEITRLRQPVIINAF